MSDIELKEIEPKEMVSYFKSLSEEELVSEEFLTEFILKRIGVGFRWSDFAVEEGDFLPKGGFRIRIWADELARFLLFINKHKHEINSYLEFGTGSGGSFYVIDSYLRTINPNMGVSVTVDQKDWYPKGFEEYKELNQQASYVSGKTQNFNMDRKYDLCFIDANHSYKGVKKDYEKVKDYCKIIAFHDIKTVNPKKPDQICVRHLWKEIDSKNKLEIVTKDPRISFMSGIGVIWDG